MSQNQPLLADKPVNRAPQEDDPSGPEDWAPPAVTTIADSGLDPNFIMTLGLKIIHVYGVETASAVSRHICLPSPMMRSVLEAGRERGLLESLGTPGAMPGADVRYTLSTKGKEWIQDALQQSQYVGPAPVPLDDYHDQAHRQRIVYDRTDPRDLAKALEHLVLPEDLVANLGPAVNSARSMLLYGPPGNGKTTVAIGLSKCFRQHVYVPHCIEIDGQIVKIFDPTIHEPVDVEESHGLPHLANKKIVTSDVDQRWVLCHRPIAITGGELSLEMLDLRFNPIAKYYEAPVQVKTNGGVFVVDDFGRQLTTPEQMLNRWIIPLENGYDYLTTANGKKFPIIFDGLIIFSTNLPPSKLMDSAMLRRIPYKFFFDPPSEAEFRTIYDNYCNAHGLVPDHTLLDELLIEFYRPRNIQLARFQPKFLIDHVIARCRFEGRPPRLDREHLFEAAEHLYAKE